MIKQFIYIILLIVAVVACEEVYNPELDEVDDFLVVEAIFISNQPQNEIYLYKTLGFNDQNNHYPSVTGALVYLVDENDNKVLCKETTSGTYRVNYQLNPAGSYHIYFEYDGEEYESGIQTVPEPPVIDSIYGEYSSRVFTTGASNSSDKIEEEKGFQIYANMNYKGDLNHYRFYARKIMQFFDFYDSIIPFSPDPVPFPIYCWRAYYPTGIFNIAGPPEYSTQKNIIRHSLEFFESDSRKYIADTLSFAGWIYILYQYGINEDTYNFYKDLNSQLDAEGKIFDPVYVQAVGNIICTSDPKKIVLGNFEISSFNEKRFFLNYSENKDSIVAFRNIPYFYEIPERGNIKNIQPDFWERNSRTYPNE